MDLPLPTNSAWRAISEESIQDNGLKELDSLAYQQQSCNGKMQSPLLMWQHKMLNAFIDGIASVLPIEIFTILTGDEMKHLLCGNPEIDVDMLQKVVEYEGCSDTDTFIRNFWDILREFSNDERKRFLQFVWARNRLPMKELDFDAPFKIQKDTSNGDSGDALPTASTCFFSLSLPEYRNKSQLKKKLLFAINNATTMEMDFQTNSAEIAEGFRAF